MSPARQIGINHVAREVGDLDAALDLYGRSFSRRARAAFRRPVGRPVRDRRVRRIHFTKAGGVLRGMGLEGLEKSESARADLAAKGLAD